MVYHFFSRWKSVETELSSLRQELIEMEEFFKIRVEMHALIWQEIQKKSIDFAKLYDTARELLLFYKDARYTAGYQLLLQKIQKVKTSDITQTEINQFYELIHILSEKMEHEKRSSIILLEELLAGKFSDKSRFYEIQDLLKVEEQFLLVDDEALNKLIESFLIKKNPGAGAVGYVRLLEAISRGIVRCEQGVLWRGPKQIQGVRIVGNKIILKGDHYSSIQQARWIQGDKLLYASMSDPFSYFVERGRLQGLTSVEIQKMLGIKNAQAVVGLEIEIFPEQVYLKVGEKIPTHFAIAELKREQVRRVITLAHLI